MEKLKLGDKIIWRGEWGKGPPIVRTVASLFYDPNGQGKNGHEVPDVEWNKMIDRSVVVDMDNGHWAYGFQCKPIG
jgi:hypothetical protein